MAVRVSVVVVSSDECEQPLLFQWCSDDPERSRCEMATRMGVCFC